MERPISLGCLKVKHTLVFLVAPRTNTKKPACGLGGVAPIIDTKKVVCLKEIMLYAQIRITVLVLLINIIFLLFLAPTGRGGGGTI